MTEIRLIKNEKCWLEQTALSQLDGIAKLPGVVRAVGLPDLHAGKSPVGIAVEIRDMIYPHLIGNDIGCGMALFETNCDLRKFKFNRFESRLNHIRMLADLQLESHYEEECPIHDYGTLGGGNHFAEFQKLEKIYDMDALSEIALNEKKLLLLVHSGSRNYGQQIFKEHISPLGLLKDSREAKNYLAAHNNALLWARRNRCAVAQKLMSHLNYDAEPKRLLDCCHNFVERCEDIFVHRKGAVSMQQGPVIIPGSRGSLTYIVKPAVHVDESAMSLSHGAGRKWARSLCKPRIRKMYDRDSIRQTQLGSKVICHDTDLLFQEAPEAYKKIEHVVDALVSHGLCSIIATLRPLITYKG